MEIIKVEGFVLNTIDYKENSRILNVLTKEYGLIGIISKGCKKLKSNLRILSNIYSYATFNIYYKENGLSTLVDGSIINYFENIRSDIIKISYLAYISELTLGIYKECEDNEIYDLFINAVLKLEEGLEPKVITNILELQYLPYIGIGLNLDECVKCGSKKVSTISLSSGGFICNKCLVNETIYSEKVIKMIRLYYYVDISKISKLDIDEDVKNIINDIVTMYYDEFSGIHPKSKKFLNEIV